MLIAPLVGSRREKLYRRFIHNSVVYSFEPVVVPPQHLVVKLVPWAVVPRTYYDLFRYVYRTVKSKRPLGPMVVPWATGINRNLDFIKSGVWYSPPPERSIVGYLSTLQ